MRLKLIEILVLIGYLISFGNCLYEDQISKWDFRQQFIGKLEHLSTHLSQSGHKVIIGSESSTISSIHLRNGTINWRHILEKCKINTIAGYVDETAVYNEFDGNELDEKGLQLLSINCNGYFIRNWNADSGSLNWEKTLPNSIVTVDEINSDNYLFHVNFKTNEIYIAKYEDSKSKLIIYSYNYESEQLKPLVETSVALNSQIFSLSCKFINERYFICLNRDRLAVEFLNVDLSSFSSAQSSSPSQGSQANVDVAKRIELTSVKLSSLGIDAKEKQQTINLVTFPNLMYTSSAYKEKPFIAINLGEQGFIVFKINNNEINLLKILPNVKKISIEQVNRRGKGDDYNFLLFALISKPEELKTEQEEKLQTNQAMFNEQFKVAVFNLNDWNEDKSLTGHFRMMVSSAKDIEKLAILPFVQGDKFFYKILLSTVDGLLILTSTQGKVSWKREEALASIISAEIMDLPLSELDATIERTLGIHTENILSQFLNRISSQALQMQTYLMTTFDEFYKTLILRNFKEDDRSEEEEDLNLNGFSEYSSTRNGGNVMNGKNDNHLFRDKFGLHKVIVILTRSGKLFGIDTLNGRYLWSFYDEKLGKDLYYSNRKEKIFVQRTTAHYPYPARCSVVTSNGYIISFNPINGKIYEKMNLNVSTKQVMILSHFNEEFIKGLVILDYDNNVHLYPSDEKTKITFIEHRSNYYLVNGHERTAIIEGFNFADYSQQNEKANRVWSLELPYVNEISNNSFNRNNNNNNNNNLRLQMIFKRNNEHVHSQGRVLGDRSVLYRYLNPNVLLIIYEGLESDNSGKQNNYITIYLVDGVTGSIIYSSIHRRAKGPVYAVHSENSIVYSYYNEKHRRTEMSSIELYEGKTLNSDAFSSLSRVSLRPKIIEHQNFIFPTGILAMSDTVTDKGITNKHLLIALPSGGILELPKAFVDPRRPIHPTADHREEGLIPYVPELPIPSEGIINYNKSLTSIHTIVTAPSSLESTCLVFAYGLDIFYTRVTPSKTFDILKDDFDHWLISVAN